MNKGRQKIMETVPKTYKTARSAMIPIPGIPNVPAVRTVTLFTGRWTPVKGARVFSSHRQAKPHPECKASLQTERMGRKIQRIRSTAIIAGIIRTTSFSKGFPPVIHGCTVEEFSGSGKGTLFVYCATKASSKKRKIGRNYSRYPERTRTQYPVV